MRVLLIIVLVVINSNAFACSCEHVGILKSKKSAGYVFKGRVTDLQEATSLDTITGTNQAIEYRRTKYTFNILKNYKGLNDRGKIDLVTSGMTDCGVYFDKNKVYIVYAYNDNRKLHYKLVDQEIEAYTTTHLCTRTKRRNVLTFWESFILWLI